jgi:hypothetical protein
MTRAPAACLLSVLIGLAAITPTAGAKALSSGEPATAAKAVEKTLPAPNPNVQLTALSCSSTGNCGAVGTYDDAIGDSQGVLVSEAGGRWKSSVRAQAPKGASFNAFKASNGGSIADVACPGNGDCVAVGRYTDAVGIDHGLVITERGGHWERGGRLALPRNAIRAKKPKTGATQDVNVDAVACSSVGDCVAIGNYETNAEVWEGLIVSERGGHWGRGIEAPLPTGAPIEGQNTFLLDADCVSASSCTLAGDYVDSSGHQQALLIRGHGSHWVAAPDPPAPSDANIDPSVEPTLVSCTDALDCVAVGTYVNPLDNSLGLEFIESHGNWQPATSVTLPTGAAPATTVGDQTAVLSAVSCSQTGDCSAVGWYFDNDENGQGLLAIEQNGVWQPGTQAGLPANAVGGLEKQSAGLDWLSCASVGNCLATGVYTDLGENSQGLLLSEVNGVWQTALEAPLPRHAASQQTAATDQSDCAGAGDCAVIGEYYDTHGRLLGYTIDETRGSFGRPRAVSVPGATDSELRLSLKSILAPYGKNSGREGIRKARGATFDYTAPTAGTATTDWYAVADGKPVLVGSGHVSAPSAGGTTLKLKLTAAGLKSLTGVKRLRISARASFKPRGHKLAEQHTTQTFTLR